MEKLTHYKKNGYNFDLVERDGDFAIFVQYKKIPEKSDTYEVILIRERKESEMFGSKIEAHEAAPSNEEWGRFGRTVIGLDRARIVMKEMAAAREENTKKYEEKVLKSGRANFWAKKEKTEDE